MALDEFTVFLLIGVAILGLMLIIFNVGFLFPERVASQGPVFEEKLAIKTASFRFDASNIRSQRSQDLGTVDTYNGLLFGKKDYAFRLATDDVEELELDLNVKRTNSYGKLAVKANDDVLLNEKLVHGEYKLPVNKSIFNGHVVVQLVPESSSWRIWAPTLYEIEASVNYETFDQKTDEFLFTLVNETDALKYVNINFVFDQNIGEFTLSVNGNKVFSGATNKFEEIAVPNEFLRKGTNVVRFSAEKDSKYSGRGIVVVGFTELVEV